MRRCYGLMTAKDIDRMEEFKDSSGRKIIVEAGTEGYAIIREGMLVVWEDFDEPKSIEEAWELTMKKLNELEKELTERREVARMFFKNREELKEQLIVLSRHCLNTTEFRGMMCDVRNGSATNILKYFEEKSKPDNNFESLLKLYEEMIEIHHRHNQ